MRRDCEFDSLGLMARILSVLFLCCLIFVCLWKASIISTMAAMVLCGTVFSINYGILVQLGVKDGNH
jgi:hypothetical protein